MTAASRPSSMPPAADTAGTAAPVSAVPVGASPRRGAPAVLPRRALHLGREAVRAGGALARAARPGLGWLLAALGAGALFLAWYGVSGTPLTAKQVPYLVSGGLAGVALVTLAAGVFAGDDMRRSLARLERVEQRLDVLVRLLTEDPPAAAADTDLRVIAGGRTYHLARCRLLVGKPSRRVPAADLAASGRTPCPLCEPPPLQAG